MTRDYVFDLDETGGAPLLNIFGGKITTFRELAERGMHKLEKFFPEMGGDWTARRAAARRRHRATPTSRRSAKTLKAALSVDAARAADRTTRAATARATDRVIVGRRRILAGLGRHFGAQLYEAEVRYLVATEWAQTPEDVLHRRTKHELHLTAAEQAAFAAWFDAELREAA